MLTSLLIAVSLWGADPGIVFSDDVAPLTNGVRTSRDSVNDRPIQQVRSLVDGSPVFRPEVVRGQNPNGYYELTPNDPIPPFDGTGLASYDQGYCHKFLENPFVKEFIEAMNPFTPVDLHFLPNYYDPFGAQMGTGSMGPQGYRLGWISYNDTTVMPAAQARGTSGSMQITEWNSNAKYSHLIAPGVLLNTTGIFNAQWWSGPSGVALPAQVDEISADFELGFFSDGPWSGQVAFHPQLVETNEAKIDRAAFNFDGRAITTYKASPEWSFVGGMAIWDRVDVLFVPHAGVIWTPNNRWEVRLLYPRTRISYFLGNYGNADVWMYGTAEYTAEAWQSVDPQSPLIDRMQITDDRLNLGVRWDTGRYSCFVEAGWVFNRQIKFAGPVSGFDLDSCLMARAGFRY